MAATISAIDPHPRRQVRVHDTVISYVDVGAGPPIVFLHGNPTWSYLWRNIIPHVSDLGRCLAPDLVGMGQSGPAAGSAYRFVDHAGYFDGWFEALDLTRDVTLVVHDWGSALGFIRAHRYPAQVRAIAYMEAIIQPRRWDDFPAGRDEMFRKLRSDQGERLVLDENFFIEVVLPKSIIRRLSDEEMAAYRRPFPIRELRLPMLVWPRELPIEDLPPDVVRIVQGYGAWLAESRIPSFSSMPTRVLSSSGVPGTSAAGCRTNTRLRSKASISFRKTRPPRSELRSGTF